jgi:hypothetical protein
LNWDARVTEVMEQEIEWSDIFLEHFRGVKLKLIEGPVKAKKKQLCIEISDDADTGDSD